MPSPPPPAAINPHAVFSKTGKGVQEAGGKTGLLSRAERAVLTQVDGKTTYADLHQKFEKTPAAKFEALILQLDKDGFIREVTSSATRQAAPAPPPAARTPATKAPAAPSEGEEELDFTRLSAGQAPKPVVDLAAQARAEAERRAKEQAETDYRAREEAIARARAEAEATARAEAEARAAARAEEAARARAEAEARIHAEAEAKINAAREAAVRAAAEAKAKAEADARALAEAAERERQAAAVRERDALERAQREAADKARIEAELKARLEAERQAREEAERQARELAERARKEAEEKAQREAEELRRQLEQERRAREETERKAKEEAERRARADEERRAKEAAERAAREAAERKAKEESERRAREQQERERREEDARRARAEEERRVKEAAERKAVEEKAQREAEELRRQLEQERRAREETERKAKEEAERRARAEDERRAKEAAERETRERESRERVAREDAERKAKEESERRAREQQERERREEDARRARAEEERRAKEAAEREAQERARKEAEEKAQREADELRRQLEQERRAREESERRARELPAAPDDGEADRRRAASARALVSKAASAAAKPASEASLDESLLADLDSFAKRDDEAKLASAAAELASKEEKERAAAEAAGRAAKDEAARAARAAADAAARDAARATEEAAARTTIDPVAEEPQALPAEEESAGPQARSREDARREAEEERRRAREEQARRAQRAAEREAMGESLREQQRQEEERRQRAREAVAGTVLEHALDEELQIGDDELDLQEIERERKLLEQAAGKRERKAMPMPEEPPPAQPPEERGGKSPARRIEVITEARSEADELAAMAPQVPRRSTAWVKYGVIALVALLVVAFAALHFVPVSTASYEKAASVALGVPVRIGGARLSLVTGLQVKLERVSVGDETQIDLVRAHTGLGALLGEGKKFDRLELVGLTLAQAQLGDLLFGALKGDSLKVARVSAKRVKLAGALPLPEVDGEITLGGNGALQSATLTGADRLQVKMVPSGGTLSVEASAASFAVPFVPGLALSDFGAKGSATRQVLTLSEFDGRLYEGVISGSARVRWGDTWSVDGEVRAKNLNAAVFAPTLVSEGRAEGRGVYSMSGAAPAKLGESARLEGSFKVDKGVLGSFDLGRAIQTGGAQSTGRTIFNELGAQGLYQGGAVQLRNITIAAGAMNAGASLDILAGGTLAGRVVADLKTPAQTLRATLAIGGKIQDPILRK